MIESDDHRNGALLKIARRLMRDREQDRALHAARMIVEPSTKAFALTGLAQWLVKEGQQEEDEQQQQRALSLLAEAARVAEEIERPAGRAVTLAEIAMKYPGTVREVAPLLLQALETAAEIESKDELSATLAHLSDAYHETGVEIDERVMNILREIVIRLDA
jgi:lipopolysaccharide biosynthesis regulator YciM